MHVWENKLARESKICVILRQPSCFSYRPLSTFPLTVRRFVMSFLPSLRGKLVSGEFTRLLIRSKDWRDLTQNKLVHAVKQESAISMLRAYLTFNKGTTQVYIILEIITDAF